MTVPRDRAPLERGHAARSQAQDHDRAAGTVRRGPAQSGYAVTNFDENSRSANGDSWPERLAAIVAEAESRRQTRAELNAQHAEARRYGVDARNARKLRRPAAGAGRPTSTHDRSHP